MSTLPDLPVGSEFSLLHFELEFQEPFDLKPEFLLRLRRELLAAARLCLDDPDGSRLASLFAPPLSTDPEVRRRVQKPAPAFVLLPDLRCGAFFEAGDRLELSVVFWGRGLSLLNDFVLTLMSLGRLGFSNGEGCFEVVRIAAMNAADERVSIWTQGRKLVSLAPPVNELRWWLELEPEPPQQLRLEFLTPGRLISSGRPLFRAGFRQFLPFLLRRATSMHQVWCGGPLLDEPGTLLSATERVVEVQNRWHWKDWRVLSSVEAERDLGGLVGEIVLEGSGLRELWWLLRLGTLLNVGKGAAFGSGRYRLCSH